MRAFFEELTGGWLQLLTWMVIIFLVVKLLAAIFPIADWMDQPSDPYRDCFQTGHHAANVGDC